MAPKDKTDGARLEEELDSLYTQEGEGEDEVDDEGEEDEGEE